MYVSGFCFSTSVPSRIQPVLHSYGNYSMGQCCILVVVLDPLIVLL